MMKKVGVFLLVFMVIGGLVLGLSYGQEQKKAYHTENMGKDKIKLIPDLHLVPPASELVHKKITLKEIEKLPDAKKLKEKAMVDVKFFQGLLEKDTDSKGKLTLIDAVFDIYKDFHDQYTDPQYFVFKKSPN